MSIVRMFSSNLPSSYNETRKFKFISSSSLSSWANTFEIQEFRLKIEIFHKHSKICPMSIMRSLHHTMNLENSKFFRLRHSFHGLAPLKLRNFDQKLKYSITTQKFAQCL